jgi:predicted RNA-binding protein associated with RNAse of E/G family
MTIISSGDWKALPGVADYLAGLIDDVLIERAVWGQPDSTGAAAGRVQAGPGHIWYRFWLWRDDQVVERYFDAQGQALGTQVDLCMPLQIEERQWTARDLLLDIWISPQGQVTVGNETAFDAAVRGGQISPEEAIWAEEHVRRLTGAIAQRRFPPAMVRNWQVDLRRIQEALAKPG